MLAFTQSRTLTAVKDAALERNLRVWRLISSGMLLLRLAQKHAVALIFSFNHLHPQEALH